VIGGVLGSAAVILGAARADGPEGPSATYNREIVRIIGRKCAGCHDRGDAIPLATYVDARPWARSIREEVLERRMPPWGAAHGVRTLANDLNLTPLETAAFVSWADNGFQRGNPKDLPDAPQPKRWAHGTPSLVLPVPAGSQRAALRPAARGWLRGFDFRPAKRGDVRAASLSAEGRWLGGWTPMHAMARAPREAASPLGGGGLVLDLDGGTGGGELALYLTPSRPAAEGRSLAIAAAPDGERLRGSVTLAEDATVWALRPWTVPARGGLEVKAVRPDGSAEPLLWITEQARAWPATYVLDEPLALPRGSTLVLVAYPGAAGARAGVDVLAFSAPAPRP
jgi:hypothetical protein